MGSGLITRDFRGAQPHNPIEFRLSFVVVLIQEAGRFLVWGQSGADGPIHGGRAILAHFAYEMRLGGRHMVFSRGTGVSRLAWTVVIATLLAALLPLIEVAAEIQNVEVGGELRIRGRWYRNVYNSGDQFGRVQRQTRIPDFFLQGRPIGFRGVSSVFGWNSRDNDWKRLESTVKLNVSADFTHDVSAFIEFYDFYVWGTDFRENYITGAPRAQGPAGGVQLHQAYVDIDELLGQPLRLRIGRQEMKYGKGWLVTDMMTPSQYRSFDGLRLTYNTDLVTLDAFYSKLADTGVAEQDGDVDFYGVYGTYSGLEYIDLSAYWFYIRDARRIADTNFPWFVEWVEDLFGLDDYGRTYMHTVGIRANGGYGGWDYDLELAYQFGDAHQVGAMFPTIGGLYGDNRAKYDSWAAELTVGYTFRDVAWTPRFSLQGVYFEGDDNRGLSFWEWANPFYRPQASVSFNRLFSDKNYLVNCNDNGDLSNFYALFANIDVRPTDKIALHFHVAKGWVDKPFDFPVTFDVGRFRIPIAPDLAFWTRKGSNDIGTELAAFIRYDYSDDLWFLLYGNYLFTGKGYAEGAFLKNYGLDFTGGSARDDASYVFWMAVLNF